MPKFRATSILNVKYFGALMILIRYFCIVAHVQRIADVQSPIQLSSQNDFLYCFFVSR